MKRVIQAIAVCSSVLVLSACGEKETGSAGIDPKVYTDSLFAVMKADRTNYTKLIIQRLGPAGSGSIKPIEEWEDHDNGALLPAQMFRAGAEAVAEMTDEFTYSLQSTWPINKQNAPKTPMEKEGLKNSVTKNITLQFIQMLQLHSHAQLATTNTKTHLEQTSNLEMLWAVL